MPDPAYGYRHQLQRAAAITAMPDGTQCPVCGLPMYRDKTRNPDGRALHYDHVIPVSSGGANGPKRLVHGFCNQSLGGQIGARITNGRRWGTRRPVQDPLPGMRPTGPRGTYDRW